jgi:putative membrane protein
MTDEKPTVAHGVPNQLQLAQERTFLAQERTLMAWIRTAASLITFGFTLFKFFEYLDERDPARMAQHLFSARTFGTLMIIIGIATLALATWHQRRVMRRLRESYPQAPFSLALWLAGLISVLGVLALGATIFRS